MKFFEPNEKRTTVAVYVFLVAIFAVLCVMVGINISFFKGVVEFLYGVIKPIVYGFVIAFLLHPMVHFTETKVLGNKKEKRIGFRHFLSVVLVYVFIVLMLILFVWAIYPEIASNYQEYTKKLIEYIEDFRNTTAEFINSTAKGETVYVYSNVDPQLRSDPSDGLFSVTIKSLDGIGYSASSSSLRQAVMDFFDNFLTKTGDVVKSMGFNLFKHVGTFVSETKNIVLGIVLSLYFLLGEHKLIYGLRHLLKSWLPEKVYKGFSWLAKKANGIFRDYIVVRVLDALIVGTLLFVCLLIFRTPFTALLALIMGFSSLFPFIGPIVGITAGTLLLLVVDLKYAFLYLVITLALNILDSKYVEPFLNAGRNQHNLAAIWVFTAIILMGGLFGMIGILIGIPLFAFIYSVIKELCERRLSARELSVETYDYFERTAAPADDIIKGTDLTTYFSEKKDDTQTVAEMKEMLSKGSGKAKRFFSKFKRKNKK